MNIEHTLTELEKIETSTDQSVEYEAPAVESVLTPESLEREVQYAGVQAGSGVVKL
ncbi:hypothetical protein IAD21_02285 [Abditibacteriota bacterium]|nr:hypothetical protein IAD21_02285 [Abditibacteriota bacterium]